jgi:hypothetical protein
MIIDARGLVFGAKALAVALTMCLAAACSSSPARTADAGGGGSDGGDAGPSRASLVASGGYITAGPWAGYGFTATDPGAAMITPNCAGAAGCTPPFTGSDFCMNGKVTGRPDYTGFAMLGWNVNQQAMTGAAMNTWAVPATGGVTVTVDNNPSSVALRLQLQGTDPHSSADRWCAPLVSGQAIAWSDFKTNCYTGGSPQTPLAAGTMLQQAAVLVPGLLTDLPFDVCLINIDIQP